MKNISKCYIKRYSDRDNLIKKMNLFYALNFLIVIFILEDECMGVPLSGTDLLRQARTDLRAYDYNSYLTFKQMEKRLQDLRFTYPDKFKLESVGRTAEDRHIYMVSLSNDVRRTTSIGTNAIQVNGTEEVFRARRNIPKGSQDQVPSQIRAFNTEKPVMFIDAGIHAREWVSPAAAFYLIDKLLENPSLLFDFEWKIMPMANPDGYVYSHKSSSTRFWRKNRSRNPGSNCIGVDLNRNFDVHWDETVRDPCSDTYGGASPFSQQESQAIRSAINVVKHRMEAYVTIHTYGQLFLYPYGYTKARHPPAVQKLKQMGQGMADAINKIYGDEYSVRQASVLGAAAGGSDDWAYISAKVPYSYTFELQPKSKNLIFNFNGFDLPAWKLSKAVDECWIALKYMANKIKSDGLVKLRGGEKISQPVEETPSENVFQEIMKASLPSKLWDKLKSAINVPKKSTQTKRESDNKSTKDCQVISSIYICPHMIFWNSMFTSHN